MEVATSAAAVMLVLVGYLPAMQLLSPEWPRSRQVRLSWLVKQLLAALQPKLARMAVVTEPTQAAIAAPNAVQSAQVMLRSRQLT